MSSNKQPKWQRWEEILLVDMYFRIKNQELDIREECQKLSDLLRNNANITDCSNAYRNVAGIIMKYYNIQYEDTGEGLSASSRLDRQILKLYYEDNKQFQLELNDILKNELL